MKAFVLAGEPSGDALGGALMAGLRKLRPDMRFEGVGGDAMQAEGLQSLFPMDELSVMGLAEVIPSYPRLRRRLAEAADAAIAARPDLLITIDSPDFSLRLARRVKAARDLRAVHYVAPSVWAWRRGRAARMARSVDHVLALLPFEPPYMEAAGMDCDFVGHPVATSRQASPEEIAAFRRDSGLGDAPFLLALPGSRRSEVERLAPIFGQSLERVHAERPDLRIVMPVAAPVAGLAREISGGWPEAVRPVLVGPGTALASDMAKRAAFRSAEAALAASGTVSLELAAADTPMVIAYKPNWATYRLLKFLVRLDTVTLVNLVSETRTVPECLGPDCAPSRIAAELLALLLDPELQRGEMRETMRILGRGGEDPGMRAARAVLARIPGGPD